MLSMTLWIIDDWKSVVSCDSDSRSLYSPKSEDIGEAKTHLDFSIQPPTSLAVALSELRATDAIRRQTPGRGAIDGGGVIVDDFDSGSRLYNNVAR